MIKNSFIILIAVLFLLSCKTNNEQTQKQEVQIEKGDPLEDLMNLKKNEKLYASIATSMGTIEIELFVLDAPKTVKNFAGLALKGYYDGIIFHRVIKDFMIQGGDPTGTGRGGESFYGGKFEDEFVPSLMHDKPGVLSMANAGPNTNGSQFFITTVPTPWLNAKHTVFGQVTKGMEVLKAINLVPTNSMDRPLTDIVMQKVTVEKR